MLVAAGPHRDKQGQRQVAWYTNAPLRWHARNGEARHAGSSGNESRQGAALDRPLCAWPQEIPLCRPLLLVPGGGAIPRERLQTQLERLRENS